MAAKVSEVGRAGRRGPVQWLSAVAFNSYFWSPAGKYLCVPVLNCYSCPVGTVACPIGSLSAFAMLRRFPFYILGLVGLVGASLGRALCGWACPFGLLQDWLYRIRTPKWRMPRAADALKYALLAVLVIALPLALGGGREKSAAERITGDTGAYDYCSLVCPAGMLEAGVPSRFMKLGGSVRPGGSDPSDTSDMSDTSDPSGAAQASPPGTKGSWRAPMKFAILGVVLVLMVLARRSFCRALCPLGAMMALFSRASLMQLRTDREKCTRCMRCVKVCPTASRGVPTQEGERDATAECVLCLDCVRNCPEAGALAAVFAGRRVVESRGKKNE